MSNRIFNRMFSVNIGKIDKSLRRLQSEFGLKNTPRHRQLVKSRNEEHIHELKSNY